MCVSLLQLYSLSSLSSTILLENKQSQQQQERRRRFFFFLFSSCAHVSTPQSDNKRCDHTGINESNNLFTNFTNTEKQPWSRFAWEEGWGGGGALNRPWRMKTASSGITLEKESSSDEGLMSEREHVCLLLLSRAPLHTLSLLADLPPSLPLSLLLLLLLLPPLSAQKKSPTVKWFFQRCVLII